LQKANACSGGRCKASEKSQAASIGNMSIRTMFIRTMSIGTMSLELPPLNHCLARDAAESHQLKHQCSKSVESEDPVVPAPSSSRPKVHASKPALKKQ